MRGASSCSGRDRHGKPVAGFRVWSAAAGHVNRTERMPETYLKDPLAESLLDDLGQLPEARELLAALQSAPAGNGATRLAVRGLAGSSRAFLTAWLQRATGRTLLYLVPSGDAFEEARDDLEYFLGPGRLLAFPAPETLPYDPVPAHPGLTAQRLETLDRLARGRAAEGVLLATVRGLIQRVPRPARLTATVLSFRVGEDHDP